MRPNQELRESSLSELFSQLSGDLMLLVREELELFRVETAEKMKALGGRVAVAAGLLSGAAVCAFFALAAITTTVILALALVMPAWAAAFIVAFAYGVVAIVIALFGKHQLDDIQTPLPNQTIDTVKENVEWAKTRTKSVRR